MAGRQIGSVDPKTREFKAIALMSLSAAAKHVDTGVAVPAGAEQARAAHV